MSKKVMFLKKTVSNPSKKGKNKERFKLQDTYWG